ncbi:MAG: hypothetical protein H0T73_19470 [Ardenticatenales bacterium]|nr:hypothetical protein [Ardenticatenales bacterium]
MKTHLLFPLLLLLLLLTACGTIQPVTMSELPLFPGAEPMEKGQNESADTYAQLIEQSLTGGTLQGTVKVYRIPTDSRWEDIQAFYNTELAKDNWKESLSLSEETATVKTAGWSRGALNEEQALFLALSSDPISGEAFILVGLFSE